MKKITIDPITRLEGHGKIDIFLNDANEVENAYLEIPELRGFEKFCEGRPVEELPRIVPKICGVCPGVHHMASTKAVDMVFDVKPTDTAKKLRKIFYQAHNIHSHIAHFYALAAPDFIVGVDSDKAERNILGVIGKVGVETGKKVIEARAKAQKIQAMLAGHQTHVVMGLPGGVSKKMAKEEREEIKKYADDLLEFAKFTNKIFEDVILKNKEYMDLVLSDTYEVNLYSMGLVDENNKMNMYEGKVRVVDTNGNEVYKFSETEYLDYIAEHVEPWTYLKFPYLKKAGWKGFVEGQGTSLTLVAPLGRLNASEGLTTPLANAEYERMYKTFGKKPVTKVLAQHWARVIELLYFAENLTELIKDDSVLSDDIRNIPQGIKGEGIGIVEAQRGTLIHHYITDEKGIVKKANIIVATAFNYGAMSLTIKNAAKKLVKKEGKITDKILNMIEMAFRAFDPCFGCATHSLPGTMPLIVKVKNKKGEVIDMIRRD
ncbi:MAG: Ni/Fe hydrogenase subunit alpha [Candidatus Goldbacteria bacterium]|nr:Ni/Fe hydrogenase subunit alpha [Candidatus Goldiibacteriota bacterium]